MSLAALSLWSRRQRYQKRSEHLELYQAALQVMAGDDVLAVQGVDPEGVLRVEEDRGHRRGQPSHGDVRSRTAYGDVVVALGPDHPELVRAVVRRGAVRGCAEVRREVDDVGSGQVVHRDLVAPALVVAAEAEPGHVLDVDRVDPLID